MFRVKHVAHNAGFPPKRILVIFSWHNESRIDRPCVKSIIIQPTISTVFSKLDKEYRKAAGIATDIRTCTRS